MQFKYLNVIMAFRSSILIFTFSASAMNGKTTYQAKIINNSGNVGINIAVPSAKLHLAAGTSVTASFKLSSGTLLTAPQAGAIEYDGFNFYVTNGSNVRSVMGSGAGGGGGTVSGALTQITDVINASGTISLAPASSVIVSSTTASTDPQNGALVVKWGCRNRHHADNIKHINGEW